MHVKISILKYDKYFDTFCWNNVSSFCSYSNFCTKNIKEFENTLATKVNEFVINTLVKVMMFLTTGPWLTVPHATIKPVFSP